MALYSSDVPTQTWRERVEVAESIGDLRKLLRALPGDARGWSAFFTNEMVSRGIKSLNMATMCGVSRQTIARWKSRASIPSSREQYINVAMAFGMTVAETDHILQRYGLYPKLYARNMRDAVRIFAIENRVKRTPEAVLYDEHPYQYVLALDERLKQILTRWSQHDNPKYYLATGRISDAIAHMTDVDALEEYLLANIDAFPHAPYQKLSRWIDSFVEIQETDATSIHALVESGALDARFNVLISKLKRQGEVPSRQMLIVLGIQFNMTVEMLDRMLVLAGGEPLCSRVPEEMALIFAIRCAHLYNPVMEYEIALQLRARSMDGEIRRQAEDILQDYDRIWAEGELRAIDFGQLTSFVRYVLKKLENELPGAAEKYCPTEHAL